MFLQQLPPPQVVFGVKQKRPRTLDDAVATTLEMESYVSPTPAGVSLTQPEEASCSLVSESSKIDKLTQVVEQLAEQVECLQQRETRMAGEDSPICRRVLELPAAGSQGAGLPPEPFWTAGKLTTSGATTGG